MNGKKKRRKTAESAGNAPPKTIRDITGPSQWKAEVLESEKPVVVDFWAPWCVPCRKMGPIFEELSTVYKDTVTFAKVNTQANSQIMQELNIRSIPTLAIFYRGDVFDIHVGLTPAAGLEKMIRRVLDKHENVGLFQKIKRWWRRSDKPADAVAADEDPDENS